MNPCVKNKKQIALLAANALKPDEVEALRLHLDRCPGCLAYQAELFRVADELTQAAELPPVSSSPLFHAKLRQRIEVRDQSRYGRLGLGWLRASAPFLAAACVVVVLGGALLFRNPKITPARVTPAGFVAVRPKALTHFQPTLGAYRSAVESSADALDDLLNRQPVPHSPAPESLTVSSLIRKGESMPF